MLPIKFRSNIDILKYSRHVSLINHQTVRNLSNTETLEPVNLSYATYENTTSTPDSQGAPLKILHGLFGSKGNWNSLCKLYQKQTDPQRKIVAVDARNHGDSDHNENHTYAHMVADMKALLERMNVKKAALMGHSMGGRAVMLFALKYPEIVDRLIVVDISPITISPNFHSMLSLFQALESIKMPSSVPMSQARAEVDSQLSQTISDKFLRAFLLTNLVQRDNGSYNWRINIPALLSNFNNIARFPSINDLQYDGPVLFLGGSDSDFIQKSDYPKILKLFPNAELKFIEGAGHWVHSEKPMEFLKITLDFLNRKVAVNN